MAKPISASPYLVKQVRDLITERSVRKTSALLGISDTTVMRLAAGLPVTPGTILLLEQRLTAAKAA